MPSRKPSNRQLSTWCAAGLIAATLGLGASAQAADAAGLKLVRYGEAKAEKPGLIDSTGTLRDLSGVVSDFTPANLSPEAIAKLEAIDASTLPAVPGNPRLGVPLTGIGKIVALARNYRAHALEGNFEVPTEPVIFLKSLTALTGPNDVIILPKNSKKADWEVELGVVMGRDAQYVSEADALSYVAGYTICWDGTDREFQRERGGQMTKGKSADTFAPLGPWIMTSAGVPDPQKLNLWLDVNGQRMQESDTSYMMFGVAFTISYISQFMTLAAGDVLCTGTPEGVGSARNPPVALKHGDKMRMGIDMLGEQNHDIVSWESLQR